MSKHVNTVTLAMLADNGVQQLAQDYGALPIEIKESLVRQMAEARTKVVDEAASEIVALLSNKDEFLVANATQIVDLEKQIVALKGLQAATKRATDFGLNTQNFLPLVKQLGMVIPATTSKDLAKIPEGWTAPIAVTR